MKNKNILISNIIFYSLIVGMVGLYVIFIYKYKFFDTVVTFEALVNYYRSIGDYKNSNGYQFIYNILVFNQIALFVITILIISLYRKIIIDKQFVDYPNIKSEYRGLFYHNLLGLVFMIDIYFILLNLISKPNYLSFFSIIALSLLFSLQLFESLGNYIYNEVKTKIKKIRKQKFEIPEEKNTTFKKYKIIPIFYITLILSIIPLGYTTYKCIKYSDYTKLPHQIVLNEDSCLIDRKIKQCFLIDHINCFHNVVLEKYKLDKIELIIYSDDYITKLEETDYQISIIYNYERYNLIKSDFTIKKIGDVYKCTINFSEYLKIKDKKEENFISLSIEIINSETLKPLEEQNIESFNIIIKKLKGNEVIKQW